MIFNLVIIIKNIHLGLKNGIILKTNIFDQNGNTDIKDGNHLITMISKNFTRKDSKI